MLEICMNVSKNSLPVSSTSFEPLDFFGVERPPHGSKDLRIESFHGVSERLGGAGGSFHQSSPHLARQWFVGGVVFM